MEHLPVQFFVRNSNLARSAISNLCWGCEKPIFLTSIALLVVTACVLGGGSLWLEYYCFIPVRQTCFKFSIFQNYYWNFMKMSRSAPVEPEPGPSRIQDTGQGQDRVSVIRKVTKDNDGNAYEATASTEYFINNLVVDENSLVWLEMIVGQGRGRDRGRGQGKRFFCC